MILFFACCFSGTRNQQWPSGPLNCPLNRISTVSLGESIPPVESKASRPAAFKVAGTRNKNFPGVLLGVMGCVYPHLPLNAWTRLSSLGVQGDPKATQTAGFNGSSVDGDWARQTRMQQFTPIRLPGCPASSQCPVPISGSDRPQRHRCGPEQGLCLFLQHHSDHASPTRAHTHTCMLLAYIHPESNIFSFFFWRLPSPPPALSFSGGWL